MIKNFNSFIDSDLNESRHYGYYDYDYYDYYKGKNKVSRWLRKLDSNMKWTGKEAIDKSLSGEGSAADSAEALLTLGARLVIKAGSVIADLFGGSKSDDYKDPEKRNKLLNRWARKNLGKEVSEKDAERFYRSAVIKGKKYFGKNYDPKNPKNEQERMYSEYIASAMARYYSRLNEAQ